MSVSKRKSKLKKQNEMISTLMQLSNQLKKWILEKIWEAKSAHGRPPGCTPRRLALIFII